MEKEIYDFDYIEDLFDRMSGSYERVNLITSFGFSARWRRQFVKQAGITKGDHVVDMMTGMGECWAPILGLTGQEGKVTAIDFSDGMLQTARKRKTKINAKNIQILKRNIFDNNLEDSSVDVVVSGFGLKTFNDQQLEQLATEVKRILKTGGRFSFVEVSTPSNRIFRSLYMFYLKRLIPILGWMFLGNPDTYRMLGVYTERFKNARHVAEIFRNAGLQCDYVSYFYGSASGITGMN